MFDYKGRTIDNNKPVRENNNTNVYFVTEKDCDMPHPFNDIVFVSRNKAEEVCNDMNKRTGSDYYMVDCYFLSREE